MNPNRDISLSLIIPAYNEAKRLPPYLAVVREHLDRRYPDAYEVIIVDDGSSDGLPDVLEPLAADWPQLTVIGHATNQGKGAAVRTGMLAARGELLLFADADGATPIDEEENLCEAIQDADVAIGSRYVPTTEATRRRTFSRGLAGRTFAAFVRWRLGISVRDTQCGFKMFRCDAGRRLFSAAKEPGYLFDLELLVLAKRFEFKVVEVPVNWSDIPGGHLSPIRELPRILLQLRRLRRRLKKGTGEEESSGTGEQGD